MIFEFGWGKVGVGVKVKFRVMAGSRARVCERYESGVRLRLGREQG